MGYVCSAFSLYGWHFACKILFITPFLHGFMQPEAGRWISPPCGIFCVKAALPSQLLHLGIWNVYVSPRPIFAVEKIFFAI